MNYDTWKTTNPADNALGRSNGQPPAFRCADCAWSGKGSRARFDHYHRTGHVVIYDDDPRPSGPVRKEVA